MSTVPNAPRTTSDPIMLNCGNCGATFPLGYQHTCPAITEERIRQIVREEIAKALDGHLWGCHSQQQYGTNGFFSGFF